MQPFVAEQSAQPLIASLPDPIKALREAIAFKTGIESEQVGNQFKLAQVAAQKQKVERTEQYKSAMQGYLANPTAQGLASLMGAFPEFSEESSSAFKALDKERQTSELTQMGEIASYLKGGRTKDAAGLLRKRVEADNAAGQPDQDDQRLLSLMESDDPNDHRIAQGLLAFAIGNAAGVDHASSFLKSQGMSQEPDLMEVDGIVIDRATRQPVFQSPYDRVKMGPDGGIAVQRPVSGIPVLGGRAADPAQSAAPGATPTAPPAANSADAAGAFSPVENARSIIGGLFPDARVTDWRRDPNSKLGKANPKSWHTRTGAAVDTAPIPGLDFNDYVNRIRGQGYQIIEAKDEVKNPSPHATGPHWHVVVGYHRPRSKQEFERLPKGARFVAPDGSRRVKV